MPKGLLTGKRLALVALGVVIALGLVRAFRPMAVLVDTTVVERGPLLVTADDDGRTRVRERYVISAPVDGRLLRTVLDPGDAVFAGETVVAEFAPVAPHLLDARSRAEAEARVQRAEAALLEARARRDQAEADLAFAGTELERARELAESGAGSEEALDRAKHDERRARAGLDAAEFAVQVGAYELELARASLVEPPAEALEPERAGGRTLDGGPVAEGLVPLRSPIDGVVLRVFEESARPLTVGTPILEVGNVGALEIVADFLSQDAVRIRPGMRVVVEGYGAELEGSAQLEGVVRVVEPGGFTKVSALGVEEQRVNVVVDLVEAGPDDVDRASLGDGYRVEVRVVLWEAGDVLVVPTGALFQEDGGWFVFVVDGDRAVERAVELGRRNGLEAEVQGGLTAGERVVLYPNELIEDGVRIEGR